jgi:hypothetical protein
VPIAIAGSRLCAEAIFSDLDMPLPASSGPIEIVSRGEQERLCAIPGGEGDGRDGIAGLGILGKSPFVAVGGCSLVLAPLYRCHRAKIGEEGHLVTARRREDVGDTT